jgi:hypothetical protein
MDPAAVIGNVIGQGFDPNVSPNGRRSLLLP